MIVFQSEASQDKAREREREKKFLSMLSCPSGRKSKSELCSYREKGLRETLGYDWGAFRDTVPDEGGMEKHRQ